MSRHEQRPDRWKVGAPKSSPGGADTTILPDRRVTETDVVAALESATLRQLATALDPGAFQGDHGPDGFTCPDCHRWTAEVLDTFRWVCRACQDDRAMAGPWQPSSTTSDQRTRLALVYAVGSSYLAASRLVSLTSMGRAA